VPIHFANPIALILLVCLVPVVLWARRSLAGLGRVRGPIALALRLTIVLLIILALAQAQWSRTQDEMAVIYVLDQSLSIPQDAQKQALDYVLASQTKRRSGDTLGLVLFGRNAALERRPQAMPLMEMPSVPATENEPPPESPEAPRETASLQSVISPERTNIAAGLRLALAAFPPSGRKRIVLISDGNENLGSLDEELEVARRHGVRVDVMPVLYEYDNEVRVEKVVAPAQVERKASFDVRTVVTAHRPQAAVLRLYENDALIGSERVDLKEGRNVFMVQRTLPESGYYSYTAGVESAEDTLYANNQANGFTMVKGRGRVLLVEGDLEHGASLPRALRAQGLNVKVAGTEVLPLSLGEIIPYDVLILSNIPAANLGEGGMRVVELAVKDWGVGLVMIGGENAYGPGGYQGSPIERALPVSMDVKQRRIMPSGALVVILHTCEIAQGNYWAQQIALAALRVLSASDEYGIIYYDWQGGDQWLFRLQRVKDKAAMRQLINIVQPGDMPSFIRAFKMAHEALKKSNAAIKHVIVISDGDPQYPDDKAVLAMVADGVTISAIGISPHAPQMTARLVHVANMGKGRYYEPQDAGALPQIFIKEAATVRRALIFEEPFRPAIAMASEIVRGIRSADYPTLYGYVLTSAKQRAEVPLVTHHKDPLLAHWQYGLGRAVAFTSDAKPRWAADWVGWAKFEQFWAQVIRWCARNVEDAGLSVRAETSGDRAHIVVDALDKDGRFLNGLRFAGTLVTPEKNETALNLEQTGPGRYEADLDVNEVGTHFMSLRYTREDGRPALYTHGLVVPYSAEYGELTANEKKLRSVAEVTHGRELSADDDVFARTFAPAPHYANAWPLLLLIAVLLVPFDVLVRRVFLDYAAIGNRLLAAAAWLPLIGRAARRRAAAQPTHVTTLLSRKRVTRERLTRRGRKFKAAGEVHLEEPTPAPEPGLAKPRPAVKPAAASALDEVEGPAVVRDDQTYMGRLLKAKKKFREESDKTKGDNRPDNGAS